MDNGMADDLKHLLEDIFPLPHPSPRNNIWPKRNPWFEDELIPALKARVKEVLET